MKCMVCGNELSVSGEKCIACSAPKAITTYRTLFVWSVDDIRKVKELKTKCHNEEQRRIQEENRRLEECRKADFKKAEEKKTIKGDRKVEKNVDQRKNAHSNINPDHYTKVVDNKTNEVNREDSENEKAKKDANKRNGEICILFGTFVVLFSILISFFTWIIPCGVWLWSAVIGTVFIVYGFINRFDRLRRHGVITVFSVIILFYLLSGIVYFVDDAPMVEGSMVKLFYNYSDTGNSVTSIYQDGKYYFNIDFLSSIGNYTVESITENTSDGYVRYNIKNDVVQGSGPLGSIYGLKLKKYDVIVSIKNSDGVLAEVSGYNFGFDELTYISLEEFLNVFHLQTDNQDNSSWNIVE